MSPCSPLEFVDVVTRRYGAKPPSNNVFHGRPLDFVVERQDDNLVLTYGGTPIRIEELDHYVRDFIEKVFSIPTVVRLELSKWVSTIKVNDTNAWNYAEPLIKRYANTAFQKRQQFVQSSRQVKQAQAATA